MRKLKKVFSAAVAAVMTITMTVSAFASQTITFHFQNEKDWETVGAWIYQGVGFDINVTDAYVKNTKADGTVKQLWPGAKCVDEDNGWVKVSATFTDDVATQGAVLIFNNFVGDAEINVTTEEDDVEAIKSSGIKTTLTDVKEQTPNISLNKKNTFKNGEIPSEIWINYDGKTTKISTKAPDDYSVTKQSDEPDEKDDDTKKPDEKDDDTKQPDKQETFAWNSNPGLDGKGSMRAYIEGVNGSNKIVCDTLGYNILWEVIVNGNSKTSQTFQLVKRADGVKEYIAEDVSDEIKHDDLMLKSEDEEVTDDTTTTSQDDVLYCGKTKVADHVVKYDYFYALTESGELVDMSGNVIADHVVDFAANIDGDCVFLDNNKNLYEYAVATAKSDKIDEDVKEVVQGERTGIFAQYLKESGDVYSFSVKSDENTYTTISNRTAENVEEILFYDIFKKNDGSVWHVINAEESEKMLESEEKIIEIYNGYKRYEKYVPLTYTNDLDKISFRVESGDIVNVIYFVDGKRADDFKAAEPTVALSKDANATEYVENGTLYRKSNTDDEDIVLMTYVEDAGYFTTAEDGNIICVREDGSVWVLNYDKKVETKLGNMDFEYDAPVYETVTGDLTGDGEIDMKDSAILKRYLAGWEVEINVEAADLNGDGEVDIKDSALLKRHLVGWDVTFAK